MRVWNTLALQMSENLYKLVGYQKKIAPNKEFQANCMYRFGKGNKRYIKITKAIDFIENNLMVKESDI